MQSNNSFIIAQEGWKYLLGSAGAYILFALMDIDLLQNLSVVIFIASAYLYRNPERNVPEYQKSSIVSPVDGKISAVETVDSCPEMDGVCQKITIRSGCFDTSLLRMPIDATVEKLDHRHGIRLSLKRDKARELNEMAIMSLSDEQGHKVVVEHLLAQSPDSISLTISTDQKLRQGARYGLLVKGTHTLYLPESSVLSVKAGDDLRAGESFLGYFSK